MTYVFHFSWPNHQVIMLSFWSTNGKTMISINIGGSTLGFCGKWLGFALLIAKLASKSIEIIHRVN